MSFVPIPLWDPKPAIVTNVDPIPGGGITVRRGLSHFLPIQTDAAWSSGTMALIQDDRALWLLYRGSVGAETLPITGAELLVQVNPEDQLTAVRDDQRIFWSNGTDSGVVSIVPVTSRKWGMDQPSTPSISIAPGVMMGGRYSVIITNVRDDGYESGPSLPMAIYIPDGSAILVSVPAPNPKDGVVSVNVFVTYADGSAYRYVGSVVAGATTFLVNDNGPLGATFNDDLQGEAPPSDIQFIAKAWGSVVVSVGAVLFWSSTDLERFRIDSDFILFDSRITGLGWTGDSLIVGTDKGVYRVANGLPFEGNDGSTLVTVSTVGMVHGSMAIDTANPGRLGWMEFNGVVKVSELGGVVRPLSALNQTGIRWISSHAGIDPVSGAYMIDPILEPNIGSIEATIQPVGEHMEAAIPQPFTAFLPFVAMSATSS